MTFDRAFLSTWHTILTSKTLLSTMLLAVVLYAFYYPAPYSHEAPRKLPVVVVDQDDSALSRTIILDLDATRAISVASVVRNLATARADMREGKADGVILISDGLERQLRAGTPGSGIAVCVNATYLLRASTIGEAVTAGLTQIAVSTGVPMIHEVLVFTNEEQARVRCLGKEFNRGAEAAQTAFEQMVELARRRGRDRW